MWPQSFNLTGNEYRIEQTVDFGNQTVYLDGQYSDQSVKYNQPDYWEPPIIANYVAEYFLNTVEMAFEGMLNEPN